MQAFEKDAKNLVDWIISYRKSLESRAVRTPVSPGSVFQSLPPLPPEAPDGFADIIKDLDRLITPNLRHWQHPRFFAYFPSNVRLESLLADMVSAGYGINSLLWEASPAATELELRMMDWLKALMGLPDHWFGLIQDTASSATFSAVLAARESAAKKSQGPKESANQSGLYHQAIQRIYVSAEAHNSIEKAVRMAGMGSDNVRFVPVDETRAMQAQALKQMIAADQAAGFVPSLLVLTMGGTATGAFDRPSEIIAIAKAAGLYVHADAAWAGSALFCPEKRHLFAGIDGVDSFVFNPHKWLGMGFDCSVQFLADPEIQRRALSLKASYLESEAGAMPDLSDYSPVLGRRMRALKIWFVLRLVGAKALAQMIRNHIEWAEEAAAIIAKAPGFTLVTEPSLSLFSFCLASDAETEALAKAVNDGGFCYVTRARIKDRVAIRFQVGASDTTAAHVRAAIAHITETAAKLTKPNQP